MKTAAILAAISLSLSSASFARLGETMDKCRERYGALDQDASYPTRYSASVGDYIVTVEFIDGICEGIGYVKISSDPARRKEQLSQLEVETLIKNNFGGAPYVTDEGIGQTNFRAKDLSRFGNYDAIQKMLVLFTKKLAQKMSADKTAAEKKSLEKL